MQRIAKPVIEVISGNLQVMSHFSGIAFFKTATVNHLYFTSGWFKINFLEGPEFRPDRKVMLVASF